MKLTLVSLIAVSVLLAAAPTQARIPPGGGGGVIGGGGGTEPTQRYCSVRGRRYNPGYYGTWEVGYWVWPASEGACDGPIPATAGFMVDGHEGDGPYND
ncbi:hypothetical protein LVB77_02550 [Lysobacter sp. 5GHs7-4]|uniref:hypothetical protein n=1 Tax=Lysobacter sp. 5GHs7-4 TaxID=2904253 RepID=UPI001E4C9CC3|nr:hypothetical protein [Lysobacter sp. 5GHs7-4]UHQ23616.1 hypothetical protein LVB77_02550 [Lysobacter sp. 5GHs7-4]